ncbi:MAG: hypothetical protein A2X94_17445 [Bdellovibrionales bacterium GWB1_55_8]|nr:MAG: hypothetical protein A2X94_17445 [Bdellovibrionales bacterium GWB1_55_8]
MTIRLNRVQNPGTFDAPAPFKMMLLTFCVLGALTFAIGLSVSPTRAWASFVHNHFYFMSLALGGLFFASIQWLTGAMWSAPLRRLSESLTAYLPLVLLSFAILYFGIQSLYPWSNPEHVFGDPILEGKTGYLNTGFFVIRNLLGLAVWLFFSKVMIGNSLKQDISGDHRLTERNRSLSPVFLILFAITFTSASFDQLMSLDPHWFSTIFGVYCFAGLFYAALAAICLLTVYLKSQGKLKELVNENHLHDLGKFMFAFTIFWAYIGFSQFMLIWYANLPEETGYYLKRMHSNWYYVSAFLLVGKFLTPFFLLITRSAKRNSRVLAGVAVFMLIAQWIDVLWMVQPEFFSDGPVFGFIEIGVTLGFSGIFGITVARFLRKNNVVAIGDPRLAESLRHEQ